MTAPTYRSVCQQTGKSGGCVHAAEVELLRDSIAAAAGFYSCPCGDSFELDPLDGLEDLLALNRWTGIHLFSGEHNAALLTDKEAQ